MSRNRIRLCVGVVATLVGFSSADVARKMCLRDTRARAVLDAQKQTLRASLQGRKSSVSPGPILDVPGQTKRTVSSQLEANPQLRTLHRKFWQAQFLLDNAQFLRKIHCSPEMKETLAGIWANGRMAISDYAESNGAAIKGNPIDPQTQKAVAQIRSISLQAARSLEDALGPVDTALYQQYQKQEPTRALAESIQLAASSSGASFSPAESDALNAILAAATPNSSSRSASGAVNWDTVSLQAKSVLTPDQQAVMREVWDQQQSEKRLARMEFQLFKTSAK